MKTKIYLCTGMIQITKKMTSIQNKLNHNNKNVYNFKKDSKCVLWKIWGWDLENRAFGLHVHSCGSLEYRVCVCLCMWGSGNWHLWALGLDWTSRITVVTASAYMSLSGLASHWNQKTPYIGILHKQYLWIEHFNMGCVHVLPWYGCMNACMQCVHVCAQAACIPEMEMNFFAHQPLIFFTSQFLYAIYFFNICVHFKQYNSNNR